MKNSEKKYLHYYDYIIKVLSIAKIGKVFSTDPYALENYDELERISMKMLESFEDLQFDKPNFFTRDIYPTPNVSCRAVLFNEEGKVLLVKETYENKYALPGGWCDLYDSPKEAMKNEIMQEAGAICEDLELIGIKNRTPFKPKGVDGKTMVPEYALIFKGTVKEIKKEHTHETSDVRYFDIDELPEMSDKITLDEWKELINLGKNHTIFCE